MNRDLSKSPVDLSTIHRTHGRDSILFLDSAPTPCAVVSTGVAVLDDALGVGGWPLGRIIEVFGPEASGKTTLALRAIAKVQQRGGLAAFIDAEHALDPHWAQALGVALPGMLLSQPNSGEQALDIVEALVRSDTVSLVVVDSVAALVPQDELDGTMGDSGAGLQARMMSKAMRKLASVAGRTNTTVLFTNQLRQRVGVTFGPSEMTTGGNALKYYASMRVDLRRIGKADNGTLFRAKVVKNKLAPPFTQAEFVIQANGTVTPAPPIVT